MKWVTALIYGLHSVKRCRFVTQVIHIFEKVKLETAYKAAAIDEKRLLEITEWLQTEIEGWD